MNLSSEVLQIAQMVARVLFASLFLLSGYNHFFRSRGMREWAKHQGVKRARFSVFISGVIIVLGGLSVLLGMWMDLGALLLALFLLVTAFKVHNYWHESDPAMRSVQMWQFWKNIQLLGAALMIFYIAVLSGSLGLDFTLGEPFFKFVVNK